MDEFGTKDDVAELLKIHPDNVRKYRHKYWTENIHWMRLERNTVRYVMPLIKDWALHRHDAIAHQNAIDIYRAQLLSNQPKPRGRKRAS